MIVLKCWVWGRQVGLYGLRDLSAVDTTASKLRLPVPASTLFTKTRGQSTPRESRWLTGSEQAHRMAGGRLNSPIKAKDAETIRFLCGCGRLRARGRNAALQVPRGRPAHFGPGPPRPRPSRLARSSKPRPRHIRQFRPVPARPGQARLQFNL